MPSCGAGCLIPDKPLGGAKCEDCGKEQHLACLDESTDCCNVCYLAQLEANKYPLQQPSQEETYPSRQPSQQEPHQETSSSDDDDVEEPDFAIRILANTKNRAITRKGIQQLFLHHQSGKDCNTVLPIIAQVSQVFEWDTLANHVLLVLSDHTAACRAIIDKRMASNTPISVGHVVVLDEVDLREKHNNIVDIWRMSIDPNDVRDILSDTLPPVLNPTALCEIYKCMDKNAKKNASSNTSNRPKKKIRKNSKSAKTLDFYEDDAGKAAFTSILTRCQMQGWNTTLLGGNKEKYFSRWLENYFNPHKGILREYKPVSVKVFMRKFTEAMLKAKSEYLDATHASGSQDEATLPGFVSILKDYLLAKDQNPSKQQARAREAARTTQTERLGAASPRVLGSGTGSSSGGPVAGGANNVTMGTNGNSSNGMQPSSLDQLLSPTRASSTAFRPFDRVDLTSIHNEMANQSRMMFLASLSSNPALMMDGQAMLSKYLTVRQTISTMQANIASGGTPSDMNQWQTTLHIFEQELNVLDCMLASRQMVFQLLNGQLAQMQAVEERRTQDSSGNGESSNT